MKRPKYVTFDLAFGEPPGGVMTIPVPDNLILAVREAIFRRAGLRPTIIPTIALDGRPPMEREIGGGILAVPGDDQRMGLVLVPFKNWAGKRVKNAFGFSPHDLDATRRDLVGVWHTHRDRSGPSRIDREELAVDCRRRGLPLCLVVNQVRAFWL
jgi:hypothetical protein